MRIDVTVSGTDDLQKKLQLLPTAVSRKVQIDALKAGAEPIRSMASTLAPRDESAGAPHLADNIIIAVLGVKRLDAEGLFDGAAVEVGPARPFFYGFFQEFGTAFIPAKPFMRPACYSRAGQALNIVRANIWAAIRKRLNLGGVMSTTSSTE